jgi:hypothetical protein
MKAGVEGPHCGLFPVGSVTSSVWTTGLRWNLQGEELCMGGLVSSSNLIEFHHNVTIAGGAMDTTPDNESLEILEEATATAVITISASHPLLWTCEIESPLPAFRCLDNSS